VLAGWFFTRVKVDGGGVGADGVDGADNGFSKHPDSHNDGGADDGAEEGGFGFAKLGIVAARRYI